MAKLTTPALAPGPRKELSDHLHALHRRAGWPSVRELAKALGQGVASSSRIHDAFTKPRLPDWGLVQLVVAELASRVPDATPAAEVKTFHGLWDNAAEAGDNPRQAPVAAVPAPEESGRATLAAIEKMRRLVDDVRTQKPEVFTPSTASVAAARSTSVGSLSPKPRDFPTLTNCSTPEQRAKDLEEDAEDVMAATVTDPYVVGRIYARRWINRLGPQYDLEFFALEYPIVPMRIRNDLMMYAGRCGLPDASEGQNNERDLLFHLLRGFWHEVHNELGEDPIDPVGMPT
ncbi:hypothetical protein [Streptomyces sp. NPDC054975]